MEGQQGPPPPMQMQPPPQMMVGQPQLVVQTPFFGDNPVHTTCPNCRQSVVTTVTKENGTCTWIWCFVICLCCFPCFFIPFVTDCAKDFIHTCPGCGSVIGVKKA